MKFRSLMISAAMVSAVAAQTLGAPAKPEAAAPAPAVTPSKIAIIQFQNAVLATQEGRKVAAEMKAKYDPRKTALDKRQAELAAMQQKLQQGAGLTAEQRTKMQNDLTAGGRALNHDVDDLNNEAQEDEGKAMQSMAAKMGKIIQDYAVKNGYVVVIDAGNQNTPVLWAAASANITADIVKLYDQANPAAAPAPAAPAPRPAAPPAKKQ